MAFPALVLADVTITYNEGNGVTVVGWLLLLLLVLIVVLVVRLITGWRRRGGRP